MLCATQAIAAAVAALPACAGDGVAVVSFEGGGPAACYADWLAAGADAAANDDAASTIDDDAVAPDTLAKLIYTSGTTGRPKGVMLSHANLSSNVHALVERFSGPGKGYAPGGAETHLSFLPWAHAYGSTVELHVAVHQGSRLALAGGVDTLLDDIQAVKPTILVSVPTLFNKIYDGINTGVAQSSPLRQKIFRFATGVARRRRNLLDAGKSDPLNAAMYGLCDKLVFSKIRDKMGGRLNKALTGGAQLDKKIQSFFDDIGVIVLEGYGLTETSPLCASEKFAPTEQLQGGLRAVDGVDLVITAPNGASPLPAGTEGEVCVVGPCVMVGYHNLPRETDEAIFALGGGDGRRCFRTGDLGVLTADGELRITGRLKEQYKLENGKYVVPGPIEDAVTLNRFVTQCYVSGDNKPFNVALVLPDRAACAAALGAAGAGAGAAVDDDALRAFVEAQLRDEVAPRLRAYEVPRRVHVLRAADEFTVEGGLLTPKLSKKRGPIGEKYAAVIEALYHDGDDGDDGDG